MRHPPDLGPNTALFYFVLLVLGVVLIVLWRLVHSPFGKVLQAIRQNEVRARFVGYNVWMFKWTVFSLSAAIAGLAGSLFSMAQQSAYPDVMSLHASGVIVMMTLIGGGFVSFWGPVIGVAVYFLARDVLGTVTETWLLWFGLLFVIAVLFKPEGIAGAWQERVGGGGGRSLAHRAMAGLLSAQDESDHGSLRGLRHPQAIRAPGGAGAHRSQLRGRSA